MQYHGSRVARAPHGSGRALEGHPAGTAGERRTHDTDHRADPNGGSAAHGGGSPGRPGSDRAGPQTGDRASVPRPSDIPEDPTLAHFVQWDVDDAQMIPEDIAEAQRDFETFTQQMNAERARAGRGSSTHVKACASSCPRSRVMKSVVSWSVCAIPCSPRMYVTPSCPRKFLISYIAMAYAALNLVWQLHFFS